MGEKVASKVEKYIKLRLFFKCCLACREHQIKSLSIVSIQIFLDDFLKICYLSEEIEHFLYIWKLHILKLFRSFSLRVLKYTHCKYQKYGINN